MHLPTRSLALVLAAAATLSTAAAKTGPTSIAYVEVNSNAIGNVGRYTLNDGSNAFDIAVIFAANINWNGTAAVLYNNQQVQGVLDDAANQIAPLQQKGIKVVLSILGNHQGAGIANFQSQAAAADFAGQLRDAVQKYGLDGIDFDDEYAEYGNNGTPQANTQSVGWLVGALRSDLPDKLITFYNIGPAGDTLSHDDPSVGAQIDFAWNPYYGTYSAPSIPGMDKTKLSPAAIDFQSTSGDDAASFAQQTLTDGYGAFMTYDLQAGDDSAYVSQFTQVLYNQKSSYQ
jgi:Glycosyl hydrolases family 18